MPGRLPAAYRLARSSIRRPVPFSASAAQLQQQCRLQYNSPGSPGPSPGPGNDQDEAESTKSNGGRERIEWGPTLFKMFESAATTFASIAILGLFGYGYTVWYKKNVLAKIDHAFEPGDPMLDLAGVSKGPGSSAHWIQRDEQDFIDAIIDGSDEGHYFLIIGEKGTGKSSMLIEAMHKVDGKGIAMFDAHADLEIFRIRLGRALDFEYHEDNIGSLFSIRGPRDGSALLDIERAFNKFEKVALERRKTKQDRPLILIINSMHLLRDDEDGKDLLELIQQRAEQWCASNLCTVVLNSDDYWVYERLKGHATRMELLQVLDLPRNKAMLALKKLRSSYTRLEPSDEELGEVYEHVGGRMSFLGRVAKAEDMLQTSKDICEQEKTWFLNQCGILGEEMDDDVMDQQKYASSAMVLAKALVDKEKEDGIQFDPEQGYTLPCFPLHQARYIMTRADFMQSLDQINVFTINSHALVRADSIPMQRAFREICSEEGFAEFLEATLDRISAIESLGRTRELTIKDLWNDGKYSVQVRNHRDQLERNITFQTVPKPDEEEEKDS